MGTISQITQLSLLVSVVFVGLMDDFKFDLAPMLNFRYPFEFQRLVKTLLV